ncbi:MAG: hypothetical protein ACE5L7_02480 [Candidatus Aminicenantales bacterium]
MILTIFVSPEAARDIIAADEGGLNGGLFYRIISLLKIDQLCSESNSRRPPWRKFEYGFIELQCSFQISLLGQQYGLTMEGFSIPRIEHKGLMEMVFPHLLMGDSQIQGRNGLLRG